VKNFLLLALLISTQVLGDIGLSRGMKDFGVVNPLDFSSFLPLGLYLITNIWIWIGLSFLIISLVLYLTAISRLDLSFVLPIHSFSYVVNAIFAKFLLGEHISEMRWLSTFIISFGVLFVGLSQQFSDKSRREPKTITKIKSRNIPLFFLPLGLSLSKNWLAIIILSLADSAGDLLLASGMKKIGKIERMSIKEALQLTYKIITNSSILSGIACQGIAFFMFITVLSWAEISFVRPATALTYLFSMLGAKLMLRETFTREKLIGITLIGIGIVLHQ
jgi:drug/metabolite transporter (DMT)-like permease